nr:MAG TPA: hypothetical protein [Caudoviricetes sp.]
MENRICRRNSQSKLTNLMKDGHRVILRYFKEDMQWQV